MKKYKLIKEYPCSTKKGSIVKYKIGLGYVGVDGDGMITVFGCVEDNPEFWEKVSEELCVPVGTKFIYHETNYYEFTIAKNTITDSVLVTWGEGYSEFYPVSQVNKYFKEGVWKVVEPSFTLSEVKELISVWCQLLPPDEKDILKKYEEIKKQNSPTP